VAGLNRVRAMKRSRRPIGRRMPPSSLSRTPDGPLSSPEDVARRPAQIETRHLKGSPRDPPSPPIGGPSSLSLPLHGLNAPYDHLRRNLSQLRGVTIRLETALFGLAIGVYITTRLVGLDRFPIYFFTDEAVQTVLASEFVRDGFRDFAGTFFPTYFQNAYFYNLSLSVYLQVLPYIIFGKSVLATRGTAMLTTAVGAFGLGLTLKSIFRIRYWWAGVLFLSITPAWFLHSRTAFETTLMVSAYTWFIYFYLLYRTQSPRYLYACLILGAAVFYSYSPGQVIIFVTGLFLLVSDFNYHKRNRRTALRGLLVIALLFLPYLRFQLMNPGETAFHLQILNSFVVQDIPLSDKITAFLANYLRGLNPAYWYLPNELDLPRHTMKGYGHILLATLPLAAIGLVISIRRVRRPEYRTLLIALLAAPVGMAMVGIGVTRAMAFVLPAALLTTLGAEWIGALLTRSLPKTAISLSLFVVLAGYNVHMMDDCLTNGPLWFTTYGLYGMQYGAQQVYTDVKREVERSRETMVYVSPNWANGVDTLQRFFLREEDPVWLLDFEALQTSKVEDLNKMLFVLTPSEYDALVDDPKFEDVQVDETIPYPDGSPGFYFVHTAYSPEADSILTAERAEMLKPVTDMMFLEGELLKVEHPSFDIGSIEDLFDGDPSTLVRSHKVNPAMITMSFERPRAIHGMEITTGSMDMDILVRLFAGEAAEPDEYSETFYDLPEDPTVTFEFSDPPPRVTRIEITIDDLNDGSEGYVHIRDIAFR
jgi:4-amino-4-deoxy-L-arabinose transferase-like glycosyltransferase